MYTNLIIYIYLTHLHPWYLWELTFKWLKHNIECKTMDLSTEMTELLMDKVKDRGIVTWDWLDKWLLYK